MKVRLSKGKIGLPTKRKLNWMLIEPPDKWMSDFSKKIKFGLFDGNSRTKWIRSNGDWWKVRPSQSNKQNIYQTEKVSIWRQCFLIFSQTLVEKISDKTERNVSHHGKRRHKKWYKRFSWNECTWCNCSACKFVRAFRYFRRRVLTSGISVQVMVSGKNGVREKQRPGKTASGKNGVRVTKQYSSVKFWPGIKQKEKYGVKTWRHSNATLCRNFSWNWQFRFQESNERPLLFIAIVTKVFQLN